MADGAEESGRGVMSLRLRLIVGPAAVMIAAIALALLLLVHQARLRIVAERTSSIALAEELVAQALANISGRDSSVLAELARRMPAPRHVRLVVLSEEAPSAPAAAPVDDGLAPGWFVHLIRPAAWEERRDIVVDGVHRGQVLITSDPDDEIAEIWQEFRVLAALPLGLTALFVTLVVWSVNRALRPLTQLRAGLGRLAAGDFAASLPPLGSAELEPLGGIFNRLAESLRRLTADNRLLITKLLSVRESERSELAHELHDELGPCLFGIRAQAACVARASSLDEAARQAGAIQSLADDLQRLNQRILARLRPAALADLGLGEAARRLRWAAAPASTADDRDGGADARHSACVRACVRECACVCACVRARVWRA